MLLGHYYLGFGSPIPQLEKALECYRFCLDTLRIESDRSSLYLHIDLAALLQEMALKNKNLFAALIHHLKKDKQLWHLLPLEGNNPRLPLMIAHLLFEGREVEKDLEFAEKFYELCLRQKENRIKSSAYYGLSQIEASKNQANTKRNKELLENCIALDPNHFLARVDLYSLLVGTNPTEADDTLQPALNAGLKEAFYAKGLSYLQELEKLAQRKPNLAFGPGQTKENEKLDLLSKAKTLMTTAAIKGHDAAKRICDSNKWPY